MEVVADLTRDSLEYQLAELSGLDSKASTLVGLVGVLLGLLFTSDFVTKHWNTVLSIGVGLLGLSALSLVAAIWPTPTQLLPNPLLLLRMTHMPADEVRQDIVSASSASIFENQRLLRRKRLSVATAAFGVIVAVGMIAGRLIYALS